MCRTRSRGGSPPSCARPRATSTVTFAILVAVVVDYRNERCRMMPDESVAVPIEHLDRDELAEISRKVRALRS